MTSLYQTTFPPISDDTILKSNSLYLGQSYNIVETSRTLIHNAPIDDLFIRIDDGHYPFFVSLITGKRYDFYDNKYSKAQSAFAELCRKIKSQHSNNNKRMMEELDTVFAIYNNGLFNIDMPMDDDEKKSDYLSKSSVQYAVIAKPLSKNSYGIELPDEITKKEVRQLFSIYIEKYLNQQTK